MNKKGKRYLSLLLAIVMAFSTMTVAFSVFAADRDLSTVEGIKAAILADYTKGTTTKLAEDLKVAYLALETAEKKDSIGAEAVSKIFKMSYNAATGSGATKVDASVKALGGYTPKQQAAMDYAYKAAGYEKVTIGDKEVDSKFTSYRFKVDYTSGGVTYTMAFQKSYFENLIAEFETIQKDPYVYALASYVYPYSTYSYFYGDFYTYTQFDYMIDAAIYYADAYAADKKGAERQQYIFDTLKMTANLDSSFDVKGLIDEYSSQKYQDALTAYNKDKPGQREAFAALVKPVFDKAAVKNSLENKIANYTKKIIGVGADMKSVKDVWTPVQTACQEALDAMAAAEVIKTFTEVDLSKVTSLEQTQKLTSEYDALTAAAKTMFNADAAAKAKYAAVLKKQQIFETADFCAIIRAATVTDPVNVANADQAIKDADKWIAEYNKLTLALKTFIKTDADFKDVQTKYEKIVAQRNEGVLAPLVTEVTGFNLEAEKGKTLNAQILEIQKLYVAIKGEDLTYLKTVRAKDYAKYNSILKCWDSTLGENLHVLFEEVVVPETNDPITPIIAETLLPKLDGILDTILTTLLGGKDSNSALVGSFTNESVTAIVKTLLPMLNELLSTIEVDLGAGLGGAVQANQLFTLTPVNFPGLVADGGFVTVPQLEGAMNRLVKEQYTDWSQLADDFDWGVKDGDYDSFMNALITMLFRGFNGATGGIIVTLWAPTFITGTYNLLPDESGIDPTTFKPGLYDSFIIPLLEALGAKDVPTAIEYAWEVRTATLPLTNSFLDVLLRPVVDVLYEQVLTPLLTDPGDYLTKTLPNVMYHLEDGCLFDGLIWALKERPLAVGNIFSLDIAALLEDLLGGDVSLKGIFNMLTQPTTDAEGNVTPALLDLSAIGLTYEDLTVLGKLGKPEKVTSSSSMGTTIQVVANQDSVANWLSQLLAKITASLGVDFSVMGEFVKVEAPKYPHNGKMDKKVMNAVVDGLDGLLGGLLKIEDLINNGLCTQEMAANAITGIYGALEGVLGGLGIAVTPKNVADFMAEEKYDDLRTDLQQDTWANVGLVLKNDTETIHQTNMGFKDGNRQGFVDCVVASLRPLVKALSDFGLLVNTTADNGSVVYGLYETLIIPVFEAIGLTPAATSATYTENYRKLALKEDKNQAYDYLLKTILSPVLGLLETLETAPAATLMKLLPNVAYAIQFNPQLAFIGNLLRNDTGVIDLAGMINPLLKDLLPGFELPAIPLDALASCGTLKEKDSKSALHKTYTAVEADKTDAFVTVYYYLYDAINYKGNMDALKKMLGEMEGIDASLMGLINSLLNEIFTASKEESLCKLGALLASDVWECPDAKNANGSGNSGNKTPSTGDYAISAAAFLAVMFTAGAAIVLLRRKKAVQN